MPKFFSSQHIYGINIPMKNYINFAEKKLKDAGLKLTKPRKLIVKFLANSDKVLSPYEMRDLLKKQKITADVVTIYRVLEVLENIGLAHKVLAFNGYVRCNTRKLNDAKNYCHHYLLCKNCRRVDEVEGEDLSLLEKNITKTHKFRIDSHYLEFMGQCSQCTQEQP